MAETDKPREFELIRGDPNRGRTAPEGPSLTTILVAGVAIVVAVGGYLLVNAGKAPAPTTPTPTVAPDQQIPSYLEEFIQLSEDEGRLELALEKVEDGLKDYPHSRYLKSKRRQLRIALKLEEEDFSSRSPRSLLDEANEALSGANPDRGLELVDVALEKDESLAEAHFVRGQCLAELERRLEAVTALERAKELDPSLAARVAPLLAKLQD